MAKAMTQAFFRTVLLMTFLLVLLVIAAKGEANASGRNDAKGTDVTEWLKPVEDKGYKKMLSKKILKPGTIYIMKMRWPYPNAPTFLKVGLSKDPLERCDNLQTANPFPLDVLETFYVKDMYPAEKDAHTVVEENKANLGGGKEWYEIPNGEQEVKDFVEKIRAELLYKDHLIK